MANVASLLAGAQGGLDTLKGKINSLGTGIDSSVRAALGVIPNTPQTPASGTAKVTDSMAAPNPSHKLMIGVAIAIAAALVYVLRKRF